jgi:hypothetical protein
MGNGCKDEVRGEIQTAHAIESDAEFCRMRRRICRRQTPGLHPPHIELLQLPCSLPP